MNPMLAPILLNFIPLALATYALVGVLLYLVPILVSPGFFLSCVAGIRSDCVRHGYSPAWALPIGVALLLRCTLEWAVLWPWRLRGLPL